VVFILLTMVAFCPLWLGGCGEPSPPNILVISVDTLRADALGLMGNATARTPNLDSLAGRGTWFTDAIAPIPRTTPALASMHTGLWPQHHGSRDVGDPIGSVATLAEILKAHGYATLAVSANASAGPEQGLDQGFDRFVTYGDLVDHYGEGLYRDLTTVSPDRPGWATVVNEQVLSLLDATPTTQPYFLWAFYFDPHFHYRPPSPWQDEVAAERCWQLYEYFEARRSQAGQVFSNVHGVATEALEDCRKLYAAEVAYTDHEIGRLLAALKERGRLRNTVIVFLADHGENFGEGGLYFEHGDNAHDAGLRVPLAFVGPGIEEDKIDRGPVSLVDVAPTVLGLVGFGEEARGMDGVDLSARLRPGGVPDLDARQRVVFAESATAVWNEAVEHVTTGRTWWRVCVNGSPFTLCEIPKEAPGEYRLFNHVEDPTLSHNIAAEHPAVVAALLKAWEGWPHESARQRVARTSGFKLVEFPRLLGGYEAKLFHLSEDPGETVDVREEHPEVFEVLRSALARWTADLPAMAERQADPELEAVLRSLGYVP
jgi:arylsulfatase A-like enzyme